MKKIYTKKIFAFFLMIMFSFSLLQAQTHNRRNNKFHSRYALKSALQYGKLPSNPNTVCIKSQNTIGGSGDEDRGAIKAIKNGYITCGSTTSPDGNFHVLPNHDYDAYVVKINEAGKIVWAHTYGGSSYDDFNDIIPTDDGGFIAVGSTASNDGDVTGNHGGDDDAWVVKLDANGKIQWQKCYGGNDEDHASFIAQTQTGYVFCAGTASSNGDLAFNRGGLDAWIVNISYTGKILSQYTYGGSDDDDPNGIVYNEADHTTIFSSESLSNDLQVTGAHGGTDAWVVKTDSRGNIIWKKTLGGSANEYNDEIARTTDGNILMVSSSHSFDGDVAGNNGLDVAWVVKLDARNGNFIWNKTFANPEELAGFGIFATPDGGAVALGATSPPNGDVASYDAFALKVDTKGNLQWLKTFGGSQPDYAEFGAESPDGGFITSNYTESNDGDVKKADGGADTWIAMFNNCGNKISNTGIEQKSTILSGEDILNDGRSGAIVYPNPISSSATISFSLLQPQKVAVVIFDMNGRLIKTLADAQMQAGTHLLTWNARDEKGNAMNAGIYFIRIETPQGAQTKKIIVIK